MARAMSELTYQLFTQAKSSSMTEAEAVEYLEKYAKKRTISEKLSFFYDGDDLKKTLQEGLVKNHPEKKRESLLKTVNNWLSGKSNEISEEYALSLCFILKLSLEEANQFYALATGMPFHWRNPDEIAYLYSLQRGMDYLDAKRLAGKLKDLLGGSVGEGCEDYLTPPIRREVSSLRSEEELVAYVKAEAHRLGTYHNTAYELFMSMMHQLENPGSYTFYDSEKKEGILTVRDVLHEYLYEGQVEKQGIVGEIQKLVAQEWPDETIISKMKRRKMDISRKVMILLFIATDGGLVVDELDGEVTREEVFEDLYSRLDTMLRKCSFASLDPRMPFDWLILYCICVNEKSEVDNRMKAIFEEMFGKRK